MIYLTYSNGMSGVYRSQVLDVCEYLRGEFAISVRVVALVSLRQYWRELLAFRQRGGGTVVLPMFPGVRNWKWNAFVVGLLAILWREKVAVGRSEFATGICLALRGLGVLRKVGFDGRSARGAEAREYLLGGRVVFTPEEIECLERRCVLRSDFRLAVSSRLVAYWVETFGYQDTEHVIIPSTVVEEAEPQSEVVDRIRKNIGIGDMQIVIGYAGSSAEWQSFELMDDFLCRALTRDDRLCVVMLTDLSPVSLRVAELHPSRVSIRWVAPEEVGAYLRLLDYGLLLRDRSVTNNVASPTKFGEYLWAGANILISPRLGDLSAFVERHDCGHVVMDEDALIDLSKPDVKSRRRCSRLAMEHFTKRAHRESYCTLLRGLGLEIS